MPFDHSTVAGDSKSLALAAWDECCRLLPQSLTGNLVIPKNDPAPFKKGATDIMRLRILPRQKTPLNFWSASWCFYELGVGLYDGSLNVGGLQFVQFPFQKMCGSGSYWRPVIGVLDSLKDGRAGGFQLLPASGRGSPTLYQRFYRNRDFPRFPVAETAQDLAWLVQKTLPQFAVLGSPSQSP